MSTKLSKLAKKSVRRSPKPQTGMSKAAVDHGIAEGLEDIRKGLTYDAGFAWENVRGDCKAEWQYALRFIDSKKNQQTTVVFDFACRRVLHLAGAESRRPYPRGPGRRGARSGRPGGLAGPDRTHERPAWPLWLGGAFACRGSAAHSGHNPKREPPIISHW